jgi:Xaa-Pro aminopeptidase
MNRRLDNLFRELYINSLDGIIVSLPSNISYLMDFISRDSYLLASPKGNFYFTDSRYSEEASCLLKGKAALKKANGSVFRAIADTCLELGLKTIGFEERHLPFAEYARLKKHLGKKTRVAPVHGLIEGLREIKEPCEVNKIKKALNIHSLALKHVEKIIRPGKKELEIVAEIERFIRYHGASGPAFDTIVASGPNSSRPHHLPTERKVKKNEPVLIDMGIAYQGYKTDLTRVFFSGKINNLCLKVYQIVLEAQKKAIEKIQAGEKISVVDAAARGHIAENGFAEKFSHNLGHGVGLDVHEEPNIGPKNTDEVSAGMIFTVEPAIYLPGKFGIRIEDMVLVTKKGCEVLSGSINK